MNSNLRHIALFLTSILLLTGCVNDALDACLDDGPETPKEVAIGYMAFRLQTSDGKTRAVGDAFDYGVTEEVALAPGGGHYAIFYGADKTKASHVAKLQRCQETSNGKLNDNFTVAIASVVRKAEQKESLTTFLAGIEECYVVLNSPTDIADGISKDELLKLEVNSPFITERDNQGNTRNYFTMSSAMFAANGEVTTQVDIEPANVFDTEAAAISEASKGNAAITAYVERLASKFSVTFANNAPADRVFTPADPKMVFFAGLQRGNTQDIPYYEDGRGGQKYEYRVKITGWGMNALEKTSYLFKHINPSGNYFTNWSDATNVRSYWSEDCNYVGTLQYPWQYRLAVDGIKVKKQEVPNYKALGNGNILSNLSFNDLSAHTDFTKEDVIYTPENTYDFSSATLKNAHDGRMDLLAGTHLIVCAEIQTNIGTNGEVTDGFTTPTHLYRDRNNNFFRTEKDCLKALVTAFNNSLESHAYLKFTPYDWDNGGYGPGEGNARNGKMLYAKVDGKCSLYLGNTKLTPAAIDALPAGALFSDATIQGGDGKQLIWASNLSIKDESGNVVAIYSHIGDEDALDKNDKILRPTANPNDLQSILYEYVGAVDHFDGGKMYYSVPVGLVEMTPQPEDATSPMYSVYGTVRNCAYNIVIDNVSGLGTSVDKATEPIVPNKVSTNDYLFVTFDILDWHLTENNVPGSIQ